jgi:hypothetical protein
METSATAFAPASNTPATSSIPEVAPKSATVATEVRDWPSGSLRISKEQVNQWTHRARAEPAYSKDNPIVINGHLTFKASVTLSWNKDLGRDFQDGGSVRFELYRSPVDGSWTAISNSRALDPMNLGLRSVTGRAPGDLKTVVDTLREEAVLQLGNRGGGD